MSISRINRRNFLLASAAVSGTCALPVIGLPPAFADPFTPSNVTSTVNAAPLDAGSTLAEIEAQLLALEPPILLLETAVPAGVHADAASTLTISPRHAKLGDHSLQWDHGPGGQLHFDGDLAYVPSGYEPGGDQTLMGVVPMFTVWVYNEKPVKDSMLVEFGTRDRADCSFRFQLNFSGWRTCWIRYGYDTAGTPRPDMDRITFTAPARTGQLWIDQLVKNVDMRPDHATPDFQVPTVQPTVATSDNYHWLGLNDYWAQQSDPGFDTAGVTPEEIAAAKTIKSRLVARERGKQAFTDAALTKLEGELSTLGIPQLADTEATGAALVPARPGSFINGYQTAVIPAPFVPALTAAANIVPVRKVCDLLYTVAKAWDTATTAADTTAAGRAEVMFLRITAHMQDQGWARGSAQGTIHHIGYQYRGWASSLLITEPLLRARKIWEPLRDAIAWYCGTGRLTNDFSLPKDYSGLVDVLNTLIEGLLATCLVPGSWEQRVARLRCFGAWINGAHEYTNGIVGGYKPDGFYFHHMGPYPAYGRDALSGSIPVMVDVSGTPFGLLPPAQAVLRKGLLTMRTVADTYDWPIGLTARHPIGTDGIKPLINSLALLGRTNLDGSGDIDEEMAAAFRRLVRPSSSSWQKSQDQFFSDHGIEPEQAPQGNWQYGYAALGIHRRDEWLASVKGHNRYLWSTEIYEADNLYGRYQSYGQIEVQTVADAEDLITHEANGWTQPGYDWNHVPGATTIVLPFEDLRADLGGTIQQMPLTESAFGGAGSLTGHATVFGMHLLEHPYFNPTHKARISALLVGDRVIALGSDIQNDDGAHPTHTTLFQMTPETMTQPQALSRGSNWATDPAGNGYVVSLGAITARTAPQTGPDQDGKSEGATRNYSLGWIDHGTSPKEAGYEYALLVGAGADATRAFADAMAGDDKPYTVTQRDGVAHVVADHASGVTAHVVFQAGEDLAVDSAVRQATRPCLVLMHTIQEKVSLSVTDPDLHLYDGKDPDQYDKDGNYTGDFSSYSRPWKDSPSKKTELSVVLRGTWSSTGVGGVTVVPEGSDTRVTLTTQHAASIEFQLTHEEVLPSETPTAEPSATPSGEPTENPSPSPIPTGTPTRSPGATTTSSPTARPTGTSRPSQQPGRPGLPNTGN